jgi:uncharacterized membrane protein YqjE
VRALWLLPKAAPALLRHFAAYVELAALDLTRAQREISAQLIAAVVMGVGILFTILFGCIGIIAYTWDGPYRVATIAWMAGVFLFLTIIAAVILAQRSKARSPFLADLQREWAEDRVLFEQILADDDEKP